MKRLVYILILVLAAVSCQSYENIRIENVDVLSLRPTSLRSADVTLQVKLNNPATRFTLSDIVVVVRKDGESMATLSSGGALIPKGVNDVALDVNCKLDLQNLGALQGLLREGALTADLSATYRGALGGRHHLHSEGLALNEILGELGVTF
ncbi:MAG: hypothetical protein KBS55_05405 [Bacteroidales bacterium]|nr:hypothetical protein [Candidatus Cryptobacteroides aphodequi]